MLEHTKAKQLDELAAKTAQPKQVLLREAVDDLLAVNGYGTTMNIEALHNALEKALQIVRRYQKVSERENLWQRKCWEAEDAIDAALDVIGRAGKKRR